MAYTSFQQNANINVNLKKKLTHWCTGFPRTYIHLHTSFLWWTTFYEMHLLSFAKNFLMLHAKLSNTHILQGTLPTYLTTHTYLQSIFATYPIPHTYIFARNFCYLSTPFWMAFLLLVHILFTYMFIHLRGNFMLYIYIHTYLHSFKEQFHVA